MVDGSLKDYLEIAVNLIFIGETLIKVVNAVKVKAINQKKKPRKHHKK